MILLSEAVARREQRGDVVGAEKLKAVSPVAWTHVNFYGRYTFSEEPAVVPIDGFVETMTQYPFQAQTSEEIVER
jgi:Tn3 transposase DDE domain